MIQVNNLTTKEIDEEFLKKVSQSVLVWEGTEKEVGFMIRTAYCVPRTAFRSTQYAVRSTKRGNT